MRVVDAAAWDALRREFETLFAALERHDDSNPQMLTGVMALVPHVAYPLGAVRQMVARRGDT